MYFIVEIQYIGNSTLSIILISIFWLYNAHKWYYACALVLYYTWNYIIMTKIPEDIIKDGTTDK